MISNHPSDLQSSGESYEDDFEDGGVSARLQAFPRPGQSKADTKLPREFDAKIKLDASNGWSSEPWKPFVAGKYLQMIRIGHLLVSALPQAWSGNIVGYDTTCSKVFILRALGICTLNASDISVSMLLFLCFARGVATSICNASRISQSYCSCRA